MRQPFAAIAPRALLAVALALSSLSPALAQKTPKAGAPAAAAKAPESDAVTAARELLEASGSARQFEAVVPMMLAQMEPIFLKMAPGHDKDVREVFSGIGKRFFARKQEMFDEIAKLYATKLTAAELREIAAFFKTGVGAKFVTMQPELMQQSMIIGQRWGQQIGREVEADVRRELKKRGIEL